MLKKSRFRVSFDKWHAKRAGKLFKSERQHFYHIYWSLWRKFSWKKSLLMILKILGLFVNPLTADDKYSLLNRNNLLQHIQVHLSQKWKIFSQFPLNFINWDSIFNISEKNIMLIPDVFLKVGTPKNVVR